MGISAKLSRTPLILAGVFFLVSVCLPAAAFPARVDLSACRGMYDVLKAMRNGAPRDTVAGMLDTLLDSPPYRVMFEHYNRSWRPNHLPKDVFKRMILSLQFQGEYSEGENQRADTMRARWIAFYPDLSRYERRLQQLESADLPRLIDAGVSYAQSWLPPGWKIPDFYLPVIPNGGSSAFTIGNAQGYDFLQLAEGKTGGLDEKRLVGTIAHESHHLGMRSMQPPSLSPADALAYQVVSLCVPEGVATEFISGPPTGRAPAVSGVPFHMFTADVSEAWKKLVKEEDDILSHQVALLGRARAGQLTEDSLATELREYWLSGSLGRAYVLGADMFGAIYLAFGKDGVFSAMQDPRKLFETYNAALSARPGPLRRCPRVPEAAVKMALAIGSAGALPPERDKAPGHN